MRKTAAAVLPTGNEPDENCTSLKLGDIVKLQFKSILVRTKREPDGVEYTTVESSEVLVSTTRRHNLASYHLQEKPTRVALIQAPPQRDALRPHQGDALGMVQKFPVIVYCST